MIIENEFLDEKTNNYVLAIVRSDNNVGLSYLDISTGSFRVTESEDLKKSPNEAPSA